MKVALVLSGQLRTFHHPVVLASLHQFIKQFDECDVFLSLWDKIGFSYKHGGGVRPENADNSVKAEQIINLIPRLKGLHIESEEEWLSNISESYKTIYTEGFEWLGMKLTGTMVPQLYKIWDGNRLKKKYEQENNFTYDLVIRSRPDNQYFSYIKHQYLADLTKIYAINCSGTYFPNRIYDIFFFSNSANMDILCDAYNHILRNESHPFYNGLNPRDACRILRVQALISDIPVVDMDSNVCMIYR
jgi:hypothetical protein